MEDEQAQTFEEEWDALRANVVRELKRFCQTREYPTREQFIESMRLVYPRMGWCLMRLGKRTEWGDYLDSLLELETSLDTPAEAEVTPGSIYHKYIACAVCLDWVQAEWAIEPAPWDIHTSKYPGCPTDVPVVRRPEGWPT